MGQAAEDTQNDTATAAEAADAEQAKLFAEFAARHQPEAALEAADDGGDGATGTEGTEDQGGDTSVADTAADTAAAAKQDTAAADTSAAGTAQTDIWADAKPEQKAAFEAAQASLRASEHAQSSDRGRISALQKQVTDLSTAVAQGGKGADGKAAGAAEATQLASLLDDPEFKKAEAEYPEVYAPLRKTMGNLIAQFENRLNAAIEPLRATTATAETRFLEEDLNRQGAELTRLAPDYLKAVVKPEFHAAFGPWLASKPEEIQTMAANSVIVQDGKSYCKDATKTATLFKLFQSETGFGKTEAAPARGGKPPAGKPQTRTVDVRRQLQLDSATDVPEGQTATVSSDANDQAAMWKSFSDKAARRNREHGLN